MKNAVNAVWLLVILVGAVWFLQGINILPGSFMTGDIRWAFYGGVAMSLGVFLLVSTNRRRKG
jgi:hypothetical protein